MELLITAEVQERIERRLREGQWQSPSHVIDTALDLLDDLIVLDREELDAKIQESLDAAERGETYSAEEVREHIARLFASPQ